MIKDLLCTDLLCSHCLRSRNVIDCQLHSSWNTTPPFTAQSIEITVSGSVSDTSLFTGSILIFPAAPPYNFMFASIGKIVLFSLIYSYFGIVKIFALDSDIRFLKTGNYLI